MPDTDNNDNNHKFILALDVEFDIVTLIKQALQKYGFNIFAFTDPFMALKGSAKAYFGLDDRGDDDNDDNDNGLPYKDGIMPFVNN